jgi:hypothetical protein
VREPRPPFCMIFPKPEQAKHRKAFIEECRQKAWGAACHADWISKGVDDIMAHYQKPLAEHRACEEAIKAAEVAVDYHTVENRNERKAFQERRNIACRADESHQREHPPGPAVPPTALCKHGEQPRARQACGGVGVEGGEAERDVTLT